MDSGQLVISNELPAKLETKNVSFYANGEIHAPVLVIDREGIIYKAMMDVLNKMKQ